MEINDMEKLEIEWNVIRNSGIEFTSKEISKSKKYWWRCSKCGYEWEASLSKRIGSEKKKGTGCPYCAGKVVVLGKNDLVSVAPDLLLEWDYSANIGILPEMIYAGSGKKVWWRCSECGNNWQASIAHRVSGRGCPKCGAEKRKHSWSETCARKNSIAVYRPDVLVMWDYEKNIQKGIDPYKVSCTSQRVVFWKCDICGYKWMAKPNLASKRHIYCPSCNKRGTSFPEQAIFYYVKKVFPDAINRFQGFERELDIYIPSKNIAIEYDGVAWHKGQKNLEKDNIKDRMCQSNNIKLFRFRDYELDPTESAIIINFFERNNIDLNRAIYDLLSGLVCSKMIPTVSIENDYEIINSQLRNVHGTNNLMNKYPALVEEWHVTKNAGLLPCHVQPGSIRKVWWRCKECGYEWKATINNRALHNSGCPACSSNVFVKGLNDLKTWCLNNDKQKLIEEWCFQLNQKEGIDIETVARSSHIYAWWKCKECGNVWKALVSSRTSGRGCGICGRKRAASKKKKRIRNIDTGMVFDSVKDAISYYNLPPKCKITLVCKGERTTAGGYRWEYCKEVLDKINT